MITHLQRLPRWALLLISLLALALMFPVERPELHQPPGAPLDAYPVQAWISFAALTLCSILGFGLLTVALSGSKGLLIWMPATVGAALLITIILQAGTQGLNAFFGMGGAPALGAVLSSLILWLLVSGKRKEVL